MKQMLIAGGSGMIGQALQAAARKAGWHVDVLSRQAGPGRILWKPSLGQLDASHGPLNYDAVVNLAGEPIARRWTSRHKARVRQSRLDSVHTLHAAMTSGRLRAGCYIGASAVGYYGDRGEEIVTETTNPAGDWMAESVIAWENAHQSIAETGIRTVVFRIGIVLARQGGAFREMVRTAPFGFLATFGSGRAYMPWIHLDDLVSALLWAVDNESARGPYLACAPSAVTNRTLVQAVAGAGQWKKLVIPAPRLALFLLLGEMHRVLFDSCRGYPARLLEEGFQFRFPRVEAAVRDLVTGQG